MANEFRVKNGLIIDEVSSGAGTITFSDGDVSTDGTMTITSTNDAANALYLRANAGTSETIKIHADQGNTDGSAGAGSILAVSDAGGIGLSWHDSKDLWAEGGRFVVTVNEDAADAILLHADAGTSQTIKIINDAGTTDGSYGAGAIDIESTAGGISMLWADTMDLWAEGGQFIVTANHNTAEAIKLHADAGSSQTIVLVNDAGTAEGAIAITSTAGGVDIDEAAAKDVNVAGGQVALVSKDNAASAISLSTNVGTTETITITNTQGTTDGADAAGAIALSAAAGGIALAWADAKDLWAEGGRFVVTANEDAAEAIKLHADAGVDQTIVIQNDAGTGAGAVNIGASAGGITLDAETDIILDANGADVIFKDNGTSIGQFTNSSSDFVIRSLVSDNDIVFKVNDGGVNTTAGYFNGDDAGTLWLGHDLVLDSDAANIMLGADQDVTIRHVADNGIVIIPPDGTAQPIGLQLNSQGTGATGSVLKFFKNPSDASNAANDHLGHIYFSGDDQDDAEMLYAQIRSSIADLTDEHELGAVQIMVRTTDDASQTALQEGLTVMGVNPGSAGDSSIKVIIGGENLGDTYDNYQEASVGSIISNIIWPAQKQSHQTNYTASGGGSANQQATQPALNVGGGQTPHYWDSLTKTVTNGTTAYPTSTYMTNLWVNNSGYSEARITNVLSQVEGETHSGLGAALVLETVSDDNNLGIYWTRNRNHTTYSWTNQDTSASITDYTWGQGPGYAIQGVFDNREMVFGYYANDYNAIMAGALSSGNSTSYHPLMNPVAALGNAGSLYLKEQADGAADRTGYGQVWVDATASSNDLYFTNEAGNDIQITDGSSLAGGAGSLSGLGSTDNVILRANGTGGQTAQGSGITIDDSNHMTTPGNIKLDSDGGIIYFGDDQEITMTHAADTSLTVGGAGSTTGMIINNTATDGDPFLAFALSGTQTFTMGIDDGDSDKFKIGTSAIGTSTAFSMDSSGNVAITGDLTVTGNDLTFGNGATIVNTSSSVLTITEAQTNFSGDIQVGGNDIKASDGTTALTLSGANVTVAGNLTVSGTTTTIDSTTIATEEAMLSMGTGQTATDADALDFGFYGTYDESTTQKYKGLFVDASDSDTFKFFTGSQTEPTTTVNTGATGYTLAPVDMAALSATSGAFSTDVSVGDDLSLTSDSAVFNMGAGNDFTITHDGTTGATLAGNPITITSAGAGTWSTSSGALTLTSAAAATWSTSAGNLTIDSAAATLNLDGHTGVQITSSNSGNIDLDSVADIVLDAADNGEVHLQDAGTTYTTFSHGTTAIANIEDSAGATVVDTWDSSVYTAVKYLLIVEDVTNANQRMAVEMLVMGDDEPTNSAAYYTTYAVLYDAEIGTFSANGVSSSNNIQLKYTPTATGSVVNHQVRVVAQRVACL